MKRGEKWKHVYESSKDVKRMEIVGRINENKRIKNTEILSKE